MINFWGLFIVVSPKNFVRVYCVWFFLKMKKIENFLCSNIVFNVFLLPFFIFFAKTCTSVSAYFFFASDNTGRLTQAILSHFPHIFSTFSFISWDSFPDTFPNAFSLTTFFLMTNFCNVIFSNKHFFLKNFLTLFFGHCF